MVPIDEEAVTLGLRPARPADDELLLTLSADRIGADLAAAGLDPGMASPVAALQATAREAAYRANWPGATDFVVEVDGEPAGRLLVDEAPDCHRIVDLALLGRFRGRGLGTRLLAGVTARADAAGVPVRLTVARASAAVALYRRAGFDVVADQGLDLAMQRQPR
ncbi:MAG: GNAT family N-acetyltransferase [Actinobacteria bacterium]|nr:GNAT family N-acetyltransferase [Actinomycetota bacterium]